MLQSRFLGKHGPGCSAETAEKARLETGHHLAVRPRFLAEVADPWFGTLFCSARQVKFCRAGMWQSIPDFRCDFPWTLRMYFDVPAKVVQLAALSSEQQISPLAQPGRLRW